MFSDLFVKLWENGIIQKGIAETLYMVVVSTTAAYLLGLPLGVLLSCTAKGGIHPIPWLNRILSAVVNIFRSIPFIILMVAMLPLSKIIIGVSLGNEAMIVMLVLAASPYVARMVETSLNEVGNGVIEAARSMGAGTFAVICKVLLPEAKPSLLSGAVISTITILGYSAMAGTIGGGGLGQIAITYGYQRSKYDIIVVCVVLIVLIVQVIQEVGLRLARKSDKRAKQ